MEELHPKARKIADAIVRNPSITVRELRDLTSTRTDEFWHHIYAARKHPDYGKEINRWILTGNGERRKRFG